MLRSLVLTMALGSLVACGPKKGGTLAVDTPVLPYKAPDIEELSGVSDEPEEPADEPSAEPAPTPAPPAAAAPAPTAQPNSATATKPPVATPAKAPAKAPATPATPAKKP